MPMGFAQNVPYIKPLFLVGVMSMMYCITGNFFYITVNLHDMPLFILEKNDEIISFNARGDELCDPLN